jgi:CTP synthase
MNQNTILFLGDYDGDDRLQQATRGAVLEAAAARRTVVNTRWMDGEHLALYPGMVAECSAVVLAPPPSRRGARPLPDAMLVALTMVRTRKLPFLATGEYHGLVFVELARERLGMRGAGNSLLDERTPDPVVHRVFAPQSGNPRREVELEIQPHPLLDPWYGDRRRVTEVTDIRSGLNPDYASAIFEAGLVPVGVDRQDGRPYLHVLEDHPFHVTAAFLPQLRSSKNHPHPLFSALLEASLAASA